MNKYAIFRRTGVLQGEIVFESESELRVAVEYRRLVTAHSDSHAYVVQACLPLAYRTMEWQANWQDAASFCLCMWQADAIERGYGEINPNGHFAWR